MWEIFNMHAALEVAERANEIQVHKAEIVDFLFCIYTTFFVTLRYIYANEAN